MKLQTKHKSSITHNVRVYETVGIRYTYLSETEKLTKCKWAKKTHNTPLFYILCCVQYFMTKDSLADQIYQTVDNGMAFNDTKEEIIENIKTLLETLEPKNRYSFSKWGQPSEQSTPEKCWE